jgi:hypothetical protein
MTTENRNAPTQKPTDIAINPGDEAPPETTGTGENICPEAGYAAETGPQHACYTAGNKRAISTILE